MRIVTMIMGLCVLMNSHFARSETPIDISNVLLKKYPYLIRMESEGWTLTDDEDEIQSFKMSKENDPIIRLRGQGLIHAPIAKVAQVIFDNARCIEWMDQLEDTRILKEISEYDQITYSHIATPRIILKDREFITHASVHYDPKIKTIYVTLEPGDDSLLKPTQYIRGVLSGGFLLKQHGEGQKTYLITEMRADPKGDVPKWIVNLFQGGWAKKTIQRIREQVKKTDIIPHPKVIEVMQKGEAIL